MDFMVYQSQSHPSGAGSSREFRATSYTLFVAESSKLASWEVQDVHIVCSLDKAAGFCVYITQAHPLFLGHLLYLVPHNAPVAGSGVVRMDPLHFLAGCRRRGLNQA